MVIRAAKERAGVGRRIRVGLAGRRSGAPAAPSTPRTTYTTLEPLPAVHLPFEVRSEKQLTQGQSRLSGLRLNPRLQQRSGKV